MKHIIFLSTKELKEIENGQTIKRDIEGEKIVVVKADTIKEAFSVIDKENKK